MYAQISENYRLVGRSLYKKSGDSFVHCAVVPSHIKGLKKAADWYENAPVM